MRQRPERWASYAGVVAVVLWIVGVVVMESAGPPGEGAPDSEYLTYVQDNSNAILTGGWVFMLGSLAMIVFAVVLRQRLLAAEGGPGLLANIAFAGALVVGIFGLLIPAPQIAAAISADDISASTAAALSTLDDAFFVGAELAALLLALAAGLLALARRLFPKWFAFFSLLLALVLLIGPIGWIGLIFGLPVWILVATFFLLRSDRVEAAPARDPAG